jgi:hypoxia up-regulated 1
MFSIASISSYGQVINNGSMDPLDYAEDTVLCRVDERRKIIWVGRDKHCKSTAFRFQTCSNQTQAFRFPQDFFSSLKYIQGAPYNSDIVTYFTSISAAQISETDRKTVVLKQSDGTEWGMEELIAMQLSYVKKLAEYLACESVDEVILTVPPYFLQFERDSVADTIEIAGLKTLALVNDDTAAVTYAVTMTFSTTPEYHVIYDAGASSTCAIVVSFTVAEDPKTKSPYTQINVLGAGYDRNTGGTELGLRLRDVLIDSSISKHRTDIRKDNRGMCEL